MTAFGPNPTVPSTPPRRKRRTSLAARGEPMVWLTGAAAALAVLMIVGLLLLVAVFGFTTFWPKPVFRVQTSVDGETRYVVGEIFRSGEYTYDEPVYVEDAAADGESLFEDDDGRVFRLERKVATRTLYRTGNADTSESPFEWVNQPNVVEVTEPEWELTIERQSYGRAFGVLEAIDVNGQLTTGGDAAWAKFQDVFPDVRDLVEQADDIAKNDIGRLSDQQRDLELEIVAVELDKKTAELKLRDARARDDADDIATWESRLEEAKGELVSVTERVETAIGKLDDKRREFQNQLDELDQEITKFRLYVRTDDGVIIPEEKNGRTATVFARSIVADDTDAIATVRVSGDVQSVEPETMVMGTLNAGDAAKGLAGSAVIIELLDVDGNTLASYDVRPRSVLYVEDGQAVDANTRLTLEPRAMLLGQIVRAFPANRLGFGDKLGVYGSRWWEFLADEPRGTGEEGGVWPAILGTVLLTFIMIIFVVPIGVVAAIYLREYAKQGPLVSLIRISVNNLAGVPSIVYGIFGFGFFCFGVGAWIDDGAQGAGFVGLRVSNWLLYLLLTLITIAIAIAMGSLAGKTERGAATDDTKLPKVFRLFAGLAWATAAVVTLYVLLAQIPREIFDGFFTVETSANQARYKGGALIWASLTLALLTLPLVIVATEEALAAVPRSMREGSYACGASKWQTIRRIVLPRALPGIMTGMILALARGAGEVAPIMLVGAVKVAAELPASADAPFVHLDSSFLHLGYQIFELGFKSTDAEAARPLVYTTTLLLITIVVLLNVAAIGVRSRLRKAYAGGQF
ncbi:MAG: ABC transporter permease subunit [Planctomycetota bacterium]